MVVVRKLRPIVGIEMGRGLLDPTAICVVQPERRKSEGNADVHYLVRFLTRLDPGTKIPQLADRAQEIAEATREISERRPLVYVNATGRGQPLIDVFRKVVRKARIFSVYLNHGEHRTEEDRKVTLGMAFVVTRLQTLLETWRLHLTETDEARILSREVLDYRLSVDYDASDRSGAFRVGTQDDLLTALGLAVQVEPRESFYGNPGRYSPLASEPRGLSERAFP